MNARIRAAVLRMSLESEDRLRHHPQTRRLMCRYRLWRGRGGTVDGIPHLCAAARLADDHGLEQTIQREIAERVVKLRLTRDEWTRFLRVPAEPHIFKAAILKPYVSPREPGVIFVSFETQWARLLALPGIAEFSDRYTLVTAPSSSPHNVINYVFPSAYPAPVFTQISNPHDLDVLPGVSPRLVVVPLYASNWVNPDLYSPLPAQDRSYDLVMVASWGKVKRHQVLFGALRRMRRDLRVLLVGQDQDGRTGDTMRELAAAYGVADRITVMSNQPYRNVTTLFCQARASVVLSRREGSCVVVAESLFADVPVAVLRDAVLGSRVFINEQTGRFVDEPHLARDLSALLESASEFTPRAWAEQHISCYRSTAVLNDFLSTHARAHGQAWTRDLAPMQWSPDPLLAREEDRQRLAPEREAIATRYGLRIGPDTR